MAVSLCALKVNASKKELASHGTALFPIACYVDELPLSSFELHYHDEFEIGIVIKGKLKLHVDMTTCVLEPGQGYFVNANVLHGGESADGSDCVFHSIVFHPRLIGSVESVFWQKYVKNLLSDASVRYLIFDEKSEWCSKALRLAGSVYDLFESEPPGYEIYARNALSEWILLVNERPAPFQPAPSEAELRAAERAKTMIQYIYDHLEEEIRVADVAQSASIGQSECLRCFAKVVGESPIQYVKHLRIQRAAELLRNTNTKIEDVGAACGFGDMSYFSKTFRETLGCTPSEYRRKYKKE